MAYKDIHGRWKAENRYPLPHSRRLLVSTYKTDSGHLVTAASVATVEGPWETHAMYEDYSTRWAVSTPSRITQKVVEAQHASVIAQIEHIQAAVAAFYREKESEQAPS